MIASTILVAQIYSYISIARAEILFNVIDIGNRPSRDKYKRFYADNNIRFETDPELPFKEASFIDFFLLRAKLSAEFKKNHNTTGGDAFQLDNSLMRHNGVGFLAYDQNRKELGRVSVSFWACLADHSDFPFLINNSQIRFFNRGIVAYTISEQEWEGGYWTEPSFEQHLTAHQYGLAWRNVKEFASYHPYLQGTELWSAENVLLSPAITCNTFVQQIVWKVTSKDVFKEALLPIAYGALRKDSMLNEEDDAERFVAPLYVWMAQFYDEHGLVIAREDHPKIHLNSPSKTYIHSNIMENQELLPWALQKLGSKSA